MIEIDSPPTQPLPFSRMMKVAPAIFPVIAINRDSSTPFHKQICDAFRVAIANGSLRPGQRIPSTRALATELRVSRLPVLNAYAQLLAEGYFESRVGAGTVICTSLPDRYTSSGPAGQRRPVLRSGPRPVARRATTIPYRELQPWFRGWGSFGIGRVAFDHFPLQTWSSLVARHGRNMYANAFHYGDQMGSPALRETIAAYLRTARSMRCDASQVMIVTGSQQALDLSARVLVDPGSHVWVEDPGYRLSRDAFALAGARLIPVPADNDGLDVEAGIRLSSKARAAVVTPSHQFPLGSTMSAQRRLQLLDWAHENGSWVIEDDYDSEYRYGSSPIASLQGLDENARVIYIGTFSKVMFPSLRLGYIVIPSDLVKFFTTVRRTVDITPSTLYQDVLADFINEGHFARHIRRMRLLYHERRTTLVENLKSEFGDSIEIHGSEAGMHLVITLPDYIDDTAIADQASRENLWVWPLSITYLNRPARRGFILGFGSATVEQIPGAVRHLKRLIEASST